MSRFIYWLFEMSKVTCGSQWGNFNLNACSVFCTNENLFNSSNTIGRTRIVSFFQSLKINFILYPYFTWSSWTPMRWTSSSFSRSFLHRRWRLTTEISIFASLYHLFCGFKNPQKQPEVCVLQKKCSSKCCEIYRKTCLFLVKLSLQLF